MDAYDIHGFCPLGCGRTLFLNEKHQVMCGNDDCPDSLAVHEILADGETEHVVQITDSNFTIVHPLRERRDDEHMFTCDCHAAFSALDEAPAPPGLYRVTKRDTDGYSESYRSPGTSLNGWELERIGAA